MALTSAQYAQIAATYERASADEGLPTQSRAAFVKKASWFRMLAQAGAAKEMGARSSVSCENERFRGNKHSAMIIEWSFSIKGVTCQLFDELPIRLKNRTIVSGKVHTLGMRSQCLMAHLTSHGVTELVRQ
jgi:hypothetical protein